MMYHGEIVGEKRKEAEKERRRDQKSGEETTSGRCLPYLYYE